jgi:hypothetical protein
MSVSRMTVYGLEIGERAATRFWYKKTYITLSTVLYKERKCLRKTYSGYFEYPVYVLSYVPSVNVIGKCKTFCEAVQGRGNDVTHTHTHRGLHIVRDGMCVYNSRQNK